ncbi:hypothetical protein Vadar_026898 [Vaccinium darrowii]|uniref:Uncharacterized protein n=1 Tax=Vaccinium darrowii TaxID=229202 RepID=A0ACB7X4R5_9ERIC|nr:hypothetical protein Vadar_026898 [Vaccinium darrowii]
MAPQPSFHGGTPPPPQPPLGLAHCFARNPPLFSRRPPSPNSYPSSIVPEEPPFKRRKIETPPGNLVKGHTNKDVMSIHDTSKEDTPRSGKEMPNKANSGAVPKKPARKGQPGTNPLDVQSFPISLLSGKPKGTSLEALKKALGDTIPGSIKNIMPIFERITTFEAPRLYILKPGVELQNYKKPLSENGSKKKLKQLEKARMNSKESTLGFLKGRKLTARKRGRMAKDELNEDEMVNFIVDDEKTDNAVDHEKVDKAVIFCSIFGGGDEYKLRKQRSTEMDKNAFADYWRRPEGEFEVLGHSVHNFTPKDHSICMIDIPERLQLYAPPTDKTSINNEDKCLSLFKDPNQHEADIDDHNKVGAKGSIKMHKLLWRIQELDRRLLLLRNRKDSLLSHYKKQYEVESANRLYEELRPTLNDHIFE